MSTGHSSWVRAVLEPARRLEPTEAEVARVLAEAAVPRASRGYRERLRGRSSRSVVLAIVGLLVAATAVAAGTYLIPLDSPFGGGGSGAGEHRDGGGQGQGSTTDADDAPNPPRPARDPNAVYMRTMGMKVRRPRTDADRAVLALRSFYAALKVNGDPSHACRLLTPDARRAVGKSGPAKGMNCVESLGRYHAYAERDDPDYRRSLKAEVLGASVNGNRAVVRVKFPRQSGIRRVELIKIEGRWRLGTAPG